MSRTKHPRGFQRTKEFWSKLKCNKLGGPAGEYGKERKNSELRKQAKQQARETDE